MHIKRLATKGMNISEQEEGSGSPAPHTPCIQATWEIAPPTYQLDNENFSPAATSTQRREIEAFHLQVLLPDIAPAINVASLIPVGPQSHERSTKQEMPITLCLNIPSRIILRCTQDARKKADHSSKQMGHHIYQDLKANAGTNNVHSERNSKP